jgi:hypothetical protein
LFLKFCSQGFVLVSFCAVIFVVPEKDIFSSRGQGPGTRPKIAPTLKGSHRQNQSRRVIVAG